eukprot:14639068-Alexandrium_andersonii.AAC.1
MMPAGLLFLGALLHLAVRLLRVLGLRSPALEVHLLIGPRVWARRRRRSRPRWLPRRPEAARLLLPHLRLPFLLAGRRSSAAR